MAFMGIDSGYDSESGVLRSVSRCLAIVDTCSDEGFAPPTSCVSTCTSEPSALGVDAWHPKSCGVDLCLQHGTKCVLTGVCILADVDGVLSMVTEVGGTNLSGGKCQLTTTYLAHIFDTT